MKRIDATCRGADSLPIDALEEFQGGLKKITRKNLDKLKKRIIRDGFNVPVFVWRVENWCRILDGHQRLKAMAELRQEGYELPLIPVCYIDAVDEKDARQKLLGICSQYGQFELEELSEWISEIDADIAESLRLTGEEITINDISLEDFNKKTAKEESELLKLTILFPDKKYKTLLFLKLSHRYGNQMSIDEKFIKLIEDL